MRISSRKANLIKKTFIPALKWALFTPLYDWFVALVLPEQKIREQLIAQCEIQAGQHILEFGCGTARLCLSAKKHQPGAHICGLDIDTQILKIAERHKKNTGLDISLLEYEGNRFPLNDNSVDTVMVCLVFHHLSQRDKAYALEEIRRVLKPGGNLHMADWGRAKSPLMRFCYFIVQLVDGFENTRLNACGGLPALFTSAGFVMAKETGYINTVMGSLCYYYAGNPQS